MTSACCSLSHGTHLQALCYQAYAAYLQICICRHDRCPGPCAQGQHSNCCSHNCRGPRQPRRADALASGEGHSPSRPAPQYCSPAKRGMSLSGPTLPVSSHGSEGSTNMPFLAGAHRGSTTLRDLLMQQAVNTGELSHQSSYCRHHTETL